MLPPSGDQIDRALGDYLDPLIESLQTEPWYRVTSRTAPTFLMRLKATEHGTLVCTGLIVGADPTDVVVTARALRDIPLAVAMTSFVEWQQRARGFNPAAGIGTSTARPARPGPKGYSDEFWERLATDYRRCVVEHPEAPVKWLAAQRSSGGLPVPEVTVRRWLKQAQTRGFLPERSSKPGAPKRTPSVTTEKETIHDTE